MLQTKPIPAGTWSGSFRPETRRRLAGITLALIAEALLLLMLLSLGRIGSQQGDEALTVVDLQASDAADDAPEPSEPAEPEAEPDAAARVVPQPQAEPEPVPPRPVPPEPAPPAQAVIPTPRVQPPSGAVYPRPIQPVPPGRAVAGPPNTGGAASGDSMRVGTAPNGEPLYAATWYRKPYPDELDGYLSAASGPGWGLIACRTAPDFRVEDCVGLDEHPRGSQFMRAVLAAAWQFKVRPARVGGRPLIGSWVRIRIIREIEGRGAAGS